MICVQGRRDGTARGARAVPATGKCAACGCHRNFHRKVTYSSSSSRPDQSTVMEMMEYVDVGSRLPGERSSGKTKRFRTKFTAEQKEKMLGFAEKLGHMAYPYTWDNVRQGRDFRE
ncbi:zinc-finger homeodomain protein 2-like [Manihot esculenta]|uniref:zinc-finger homeodomain protein 2-like n=1 Tax=Manihot esculenta TaxID=3983 RepID=UPI000B5D52EA|nr:zinc-finger homeodomain protein 2-like [Manihot esculenta]